MKKADVVTFPLGRRIAEYDAPPPERPAAVILLPVIRIVRRPPDDDPGPKRAA